MNNLKFISIKKQGGYFTYPNYCYIREQIDNKRTMKKVYSDLGIRGM